MKREKRNEIAWSILKDQVEDQGINFTPDTLVEKATRMKISVAELFEIKISLIQEILEEREII